MKRIADFLGGPVARLRGDVQALTAAVDALTTAYDAAENQELDGSVYAPAARSELFRPLNEATEACEAPRQAVLEALAEVAAGLRRAGSEIDQARQREVDAVNPPAARWPS